MNSEIIIDNKIVRAEKLIGSFFYYQQMVPSFPDSSFSFPWLHPMLYLHIKQNIKQLKPINKQEKK